MHETAIADAVHTRIGRQKRGGTSSATIIKRLG